MVQLPSDTSKYHLLLIDDHPIVLAGIRNILEVCPEIGERAQKVLLKGTACSELRKGK